ncbi:hypothetical protein DICPUDRAFT_152608 [Dictyostelium purpureum]|uniref:4-nitrophenylphosphatase n=1 Tax=Dictyostelium purpureum TaxID=5786 RepID=F0ZLU2_DICPU|nr:uncharacterized protein DICPUDRAFT_152608 [Dictyostelium purpureum]EGC35089.1 hypothetical protein DICPUDRAFT_152608 [Dictyostelium purpureum]|eukprot:XP_003288396.1 hypothetical protein DICPUDRAFT_152608 [Dictyostelium purpureum]
MTQKLNNVKEFVNSIDTFIFDCDGVLWLGSTIVEKAVETLQYLRALKKDIKFVTNNSTKTREQFMEKIKSYGIECYLNEIYGSSFGTAIYLNKIGFNNKKVFIIGEYGLQKELNDQNIQTVKEVTRLNDGIDNVQNIQVESDIGAVVVGMDTCLTYQKAVYAHKAIVENNALFIATNTDTSYPIKNGKSIPGAGSIVSMISTSTAKQPIIIGKPETLLLDLIIEKDKLNRERTCMIGDRLDTDILFGINGNIKTLLVLTGISKLEEISQPNSPIIPNYYTDTVSDLLLHKE